MISSFGGKNESSSSAILTQYRLDDRCPDQLIHLCVLIEHHINRINAAMLVDIFATDESLDRTVGVINRQFAFIHLLHDLFRNMFVDQSVPDDLFRLLIRRENIIINPWLIHQPVDLLVQRRLALPRPTIEHCYLEPLVRFEQFLLIRSLLGAVIVRDLEKFAHSWWSGLLG